MTGLRTVAEIGIGVLFAVGAIFNSVYTFSHRDEFYGTFADEAWLPPGRWVVEHVVIPSSAVFTVLLVLFQATVAILILSRGQLVVLGLGVGAVFATLAALASSPGGTAGNLLLAGLQLSLAMAH